MLVENGLKFTIDNMLEEDIAYWSTFNSSLHILKPNFL